MIKVYFLAQVFLDWFQGLSSDSCTYLTHRSAKSVTYPPNTRRVGLECNQTD